MALLSRRALMRGAAIAVAGGAVGVLGAHQVPRWCGWDQPPLSGGYAAAADSQGAVRASAVTVRYYVNTSEPVVALTFDDGPAPEYTPMVLDALEQAGVPATFFMVGRQVERHADLVRDRLGGHEVGNHSWSHRDLATMDLPAIREDLRRTHGIIEERLGRTPTLLRPPFGHLGGSTLLAADSLGYDLVLWDRQMHERRFSDDPAGQARDIVDTVRPGSIVLAHDVGDRRRLVALRGIGAVVAGLQAKGFRFVTVSGLLAEAAHDSVA
ncbi:polysaccharide deacetylase family protein [Micromonosporaceae bacterium Da 78-11]